MNVKKILQQPANPILNKVDKYWLILSCISIFWIIFYPYISKFSNINASIPLSANETITCIAVGVVFVFGIANKLNPHLNHLSEVDRWQAIFNIFRLSMAFLVSLALILLAIGHIQHMSIPAKQLLPTVFYLMVKAFTFLTPFIIIMERIYRVFQYNEHSKAFFTLYYFIVVMFAITYHFDLPGHNIYVKFFVPFTFFLTYGFDGLVYARAKIHSNKK